MTKPEAARTAYLVLGAHRSGTSAMAQVLALAGCDLPANLMPADEHNAKGYFEPWKIAVMNDERLRAAGSAWDDAFAFPFKPLEPAVERAWVDRAGELLVSEYGGAKFPLLKDPRVSVLAPLWFQALDEAGISARCVIPVRHPGAVAGSLIRRDGFSPQKALLVWTAYMLASEHYSRDLPRAFVDYDALLTDWRGEIARVETALGGPLPALTAEAGAAIDGFLAPELRHNASEGDLEAFGWAGELTARVHAWFAAAARGETPSTDVLDKAGEELNSRAADYGALVSPAARDLDTARHEVRDLTARLEIALAQNATDRQSLEEGWRRDVRALELQVRALQAEVDEASRHLDTILD